ncbi:HPr family phosphocarrier protein [Bacillus hwajinpoensis]|uniref:HPr family phosphocarrier protein n=1 Tax=Guptibacillus hwajinpoensis TaxID=208199 RepID=A0A845EXL1_9BACL|nr:HPr family phosphocarrier protein [Pseudalkalibacillus hwajinpoensis]MYL63254.1 HPr family phosphocarrier protein [Pseudalkalibacillus hwajinpoensis]
MKLKVLKPVFAETASQLVNTASRFEETILLKKEHWVVDAKSLLGVLALSLQPDQTLELDVKNGHSSAVKDAFLSLGLFEEA